MVKKIKKAVPVIKGDQFNEAQKKVINHFEGPLMVIAVAGSGKTTTLVHRIVNLVNKHNVKPDTILATTFTKKAADEMNLRLKKLGLDTNEMQVSTFHSICFKILRENGLKDEIDLGAKEKALIKFVVGYSNMNWENADPGEVKRQISLWKNELVRPFEAKHTDNRFIQAYKLFEEYRKERGFITFDDMLIRCWELLKAKPEVLKRYQAQYKFVLVDEFQDTNTAQYRIMEMIASPQNNLMVVGDDDQSIYGWRGAIPAYMLGFESAFNATTITMDSNYRCQGVQVDLANMLIPNNKKRLSKTLIAELDKGKGKIEVYNGNDFDDEAFKVANEIELLNKNDSLQFKDMVVLYRTNAQSRAIEDELIKRNIPYELVGGVNFYNRKEVKDVLSYVRAALEEDSEALRRIVNVPNRFLGKAFMDMLESFQQTHNYTTEKALTSMNLASWQMKSVGSLMDIIQTIRSMNKQESRPEDIFNFILKETDYINYINKTEGSEEEENNRASNIKELVRASTKFAKMEDYLAHITLMTKKPKKKGSDKVLLMTLHRSKGLEFDTVFILGCNEQILPHARNNEIDEETGLPTCEEERRLMYVGVTRSKTRLHISYVNQAAIGGKMKELMPSRFLKEMLLV